MRTALLVTCLLSSTALAEPFERRLHPHTIEASSFLPNHWNAFVESFHPNYIADDDTATAWVTGGGAGEWVRLDLAYVGQTTKVRVRVRHAKALARAKTVTVQLLPSKVTHDATLVATKDGWQELVIEQPSGAFEGIELRVKDVHGGTPATQLGIADVQVFATAESEDSPQYEKRKRETLMKWRAARLAASKAFARSERMPLYSEYAITATEVKSEDSGWQLAEFVAAAAKDPVFAKDWGDALAIAKVVAAKPEALQGVALAPRSSEKLVEVDGAQIPDLHDFSRGLLDEKAFRLPMHGTVAALFADQLRVTPISTKQTVTAFVETYGRCGDTVWAARKESKETGTQLQALVLGRCTKVEARAGFRWARTTELVVYDANGRAVLVVGEGHVEGYRWTNDNGRWMIASARSYLIGHRTVIEAKKRERVAAK